MRQYTLREFTSDDQISATGANSFDGLMHGSVRNIPNEPVSTFVL